MPFIFCISFKQKYIEIWPPFLHYLVPKIWLFERKNIVLTYFHLDAFKSFLFSAFGTFNCEHLFLEWTSNNPLPLTTTKNRIWRTFWQTYRQLFTLFSRIMKSYNPTQFSLYEKFCERMSQESLRHKDRIIEDKLIISPLPLFLSLASTEAFYPPSPHLASSYFSNKLKRVGLYV